MTSKWDYRFLDLAKLVSSWSKDPSTQCGAVIVAPSKTVIGLGYNGLPRRIYDDPWILANREEKYKAIIHAEINALINATCRVPSDCTLITYPLLPCDRCVVQMIQAGILRYVAPKPTDDINSRWADSLTRTRKYIKGCGGELLEVS